MAAGSGRDVPPAARYAQGGSLQIPAYNRSAQGAILDQRGALEKWTTIESAIGHIYNQNASTLSFQALYTAGYHIVLHKHGELLYNGVEGAIRRHVQANRARLLEVPDFNFLEALLDEWGRHRTAVQMIRDILMYMDKNFVPNAKRLSVYELGVKLFGENMLKHRSVAVRVHSLTMAIIAQERSGERPAGPFVLKGVTQMMCDVGRKEVYEPLLESHFLAASEEFYKKEAAELFSHTAAPEYIRKVFHRLAEERDRVGRCLAPQTQSKIETVIKSRMVRDFAEALLEKEGSGCLPMLQDWRVADLSWLYKAFVLIQNTAPFTDRVQNFLLDQGSKFVTDAEQTENPCQLVEGVMKLRSDYDDLLRTACCSKEGQQDPEVEKAIRHSFVQIVNKNTRFAEYLSLFVDAKIRKRGTEEDMEGHFDKALVLLRYLRDKDLFERYYKNHLARRLLFGKTMGGDEGERLFIGKLKQDHGHQFTTKIEGMLKDMAVSADTMEAFRAKMAERQRGPVELTVQVLTTGFWPLTRSGVDSTVLPPDAEQARKEFERVYLSSHNGRRLSWQLSMGSADIKFTSQEGRKFELNVHTLQMVVLMLFNSKEQWTLQEIAEETRIPLADLRKQVMGLTMQSKQHTRVLNRSCAQTKDLAENTVLSVNPEFKSKHVKVKISSAALRETDEEARDTKAKVDDDRKWLIDAVVVRIMKSRRSMEHRNLISECIAHLQHRFAPTPDDIKRRIESLIEREYLERSKDHRGTYQYVA
eukprot:Hpha_TRINITY_DN15458_c2_g1::TRINITY_DN15458_c2_g1_i1::g.173426::m.173426/K03869/CUL3; cullin 3